MNKTMQVISPWGLVSHLGTIRVAADSLPRVSGDGRYGQMGSISPEGLIDRRK